MLISSTMIAQTLRDYWSELLTSRVPSKQMAFDFHNAAQSVFHSTHTAPRSS